VPELINDSREPTSYIYIYIYIKPVHTTQTGLTTNEISLLSLPRCNCHQLSTQSTAVGQSVRTRRETRLVELTASDSLHHSSASIDPQKGGQSERPVDSQGIRRHPTTTRLTYDHRERETERERERGRGRPWNSVVRCKLSHANRSMVGRC